MLRFIAEYFKTQDPHLLTTSSSFFSGIRSHIFCWFVHLFSNYCSACCFIWNVLPTKMPSYHLSFTYSFYCVKVILTENKQTEQLVGFTLWIDKEGSWLTQLSSNSLFLYNCHILLVTSHILFYRFPHPGNYSVACNLFLYFVCVSKCIPKGN